MGCCNGNRTAQPLRATAPQELNSTIAISLAQEKGSPTAEIQTIQSRIALCQSCPYFNAKLKSCNRCGCLVVAKVGKKHDSCPVRRW